MKGTCFERELILTQTARMNPGKAVPSAAKLHRERGRVTHSCRVTHSRGAPGAARLRQTAGGAGESRSYCPRGAVSVHMAVVMWA